MKGEVNYISESFLRPKYKVEESKQPYYLGPTDLLMLSMHYIQKGLLFNKPSHINGEEFSTHKLLENLKDSLSRTLVYFYPLAGRLVTCVDSEKHACLVYVDCYKGPGARFIHASVNMSVSDILSPVDVPRVVQSFFDHDRAVNHDGHTRPLLSVQVTELADGIFIGCSMNHVLGDGTSYWHFWKTWSDIHRATNEKLTLSRLPVHKRWFPEGHGPVIWLPYTHPDEFICRFEAPELRERIFHFSSESTARLKAKANKESNCNKISSFQALAAHCWRSIVRANWSPLDQQFITSCKLATSNRHRLNPPILQEYFCNCLQAIQASTTAGELIEHSLGWAAMLLHQAVANHSDKAAHKFINQWLNSRHIYHFQTMFDPKSVMMGSSPRFDMYGNEFGLGKAIAVRSGYAHKFPGKVTSYPGYEGGGSVDLEICLPPDQMRALESDSEFMDAVSLPCKVF